MTDKNNIHQLEILMPKNINIYSLEQQEKIKNYLNQLDEHHKKAYKIAQEHLETSFNLFRSNGFNEYQVKPN
jgi:flagellar biosynthesis/type III secretory pathway protein FliH